MRNLADCRWLWPLVLATGIGLAGCKPFAVHKKTDEPPVQDDEEKPPPKKKSPFDWLNHLRDDRALEVERHLGS